LPPRSASASPANPKPVFVCKVYDFRTDRIANRPFFKANHNTPFCQMRSQIFLFCRRAKSPAIRFCSFFIAKSRPFMPISGTIKPLQEKPML
ncbi:MAG: hypothetical protein PVG41_13855, partial [Desulfobacteraceae bacterium]